MEASVPHRPQKNTKQNKKNLAHSTAASLGLWDQSHSSSVIFNRLLLSLSFSLNPSFFISTSCWFFFVFHFIYFLLSLLFSLILFMLYLSVPYFSVYTVPLSTPPLLSFLCSIALHTTQLVCPQVLLQVDSSGRQGC